MLWLAFGLLWLAWGLTSKRTTRRQTWRSRLPYLAMIASAFAILFVPALRPGPLGLRIWPNAVSTESLAAALTAVGFGIAIWARFHLGRNWSANVTIKLDHTLIQTGPYAFVRHPIYLGLSTAAAGLVVLNGDAGSAIGLALLLTMYRRKFLLEEDFMTQQFGDSYREYKRNVKALVPYLW